MLQLLENASKVLSAGQAGGNGSDQLSGVRNCSGLPSSGAGSPCPEGEGVKLNHPHCPVVFGLPRAGLEHKRLRAWTDFP